MNKEITIQIPKGLEVTIKIPEGLETDTNKSSLIEGKIIFKEEENSLPTTNEEAVEFLPDECYYIDPNGVIKKTKDYTRKDSNTITTKELAEAFLALMQLVKFRDIWNGDWKADWTQDYNKYVIIFQKTEKVCDYFVYDPEVLSFKSAELRDKFSETFDELIQTAKPLL